MSQESLLIELGTEELPPKALKTLSDAFTAGIVSGLARQRLGHGSVRSYATPRRLALVIEALELQAADEAIEVFGPPADRARTEDGEWSPAAQGFARKNNVTPEELEVAETEKGPRLVFRSQASGVRAVDCLPELISQSLRDLPVPKRMRWGSSKTEFVRPVHWLVLMLGDEVVDCEILDLAAGNRSRGHRFHSEGDLLLTGPANYEAQLREAFVIADFEQRRDMIVEQVNAEAEKVNARAVIDEDLLNEVTALVEWPVALTGGFEERFLQVPAEALISSMKEHQKYFYLLDDKDQLLPRFITVANIESKDPAQVIDGNERVIRPRLSDADFFFNSDKQRSLESRVEQLGNIVFQQKLGSLHDKTQRLVALSDWLAAQLGAEQEQARRSALLSKTDLLTLMVGEFANMQGIAGSYYAIHDGEPEPVAQALQQQYWPRYSGDTLPQGPVATCLALADRLDTLVGIFGIGQAPTGSKDPFALRRASLGVLRILVEGELSLDLQQCLQAAADQYPAGLLQEDTVDQVMAYMLERFRAWYEDESIPAEVFKAVSARALTMPLDIHRRVHAVDAFSRLPQSAALAAANKRVSNILAKQGPDFVAQEVSKDLLQDAAEQSLAEQLMERRKGVDELLEQGCYTEALTTLADLQPAVDRFFDEVMVMADDEAVRNNRLYLLSALRNSFLQVADISLLAPSK
ncbi:MAG: glycine--tRNA ligase subunit beta [Halieaceae bacterium]